MNCSESRRLQRLLRRLWQELHGGGGGPPGPAPSSGSSPAPDPTGGAERGGDDAPLYLLLIMIFYGCLAGGLILAYTRCRKPEAKRDPHHLCVERDWAAAAAGGEAPQPERPSSADRRRP